MLEHLQSNIIMIGSQPEQTTVLGPHQQIQLINIFINVALINWAGLNWLNQLCLLFWLDFGAIAKPYGRCRPAIVRTWDLSSTRDWTNKSDVLLCCFKKGRISMVVVEFSLTYVAVWTIIVIVCMCLYIYSLYSCTWVYGWSPSEFGMAQAIQKSAAIPAADPRKFVSVREAKFLFGTRESLMEDVERQAEYLPVLHRTAGC